MTNYTFASDNQTKIDSLNQILLKTTNDSTSFDVCFKLGRQWESLNFDSAMYYYEKCITISEHNDWLHEKAKILLNIGFAYMYVKHSKDAIDYWLKGLELYIKINDSIGVMNTYYNLGYFYATFEDFPKSIENFIKAEEFALELNHDKRLASIYNNLGLMYNYTGLYDKANTYNFKSLKLCESIGDKSIGNTHINIGLNYHEAGNLEKSLEHYFKGLSIFQASGEKPYIALSLKNIGDNYMDYNLDSAVRYYNKAYLIYRELNDLESISRHFMVMGIINYKRNNYVNAASNYYKAIDILPKNGSRKLLFTIYSNIIDLNLYLVDSADVNKQKLLNKTIRFSKEMNQIALELGSYIMETKSYEKLYKAYIKMGNSKQAIKFAEQYIIAKDSLFSEQKQKTVAELQTKYETEKKELEINLLNSENELINTRLSQSDSRRKTQRVTIYLLIIGFLIVVIFIIIIYRFYLQKRKANTKLTTQNTIISKQKEEKEVLLKEIHHRVKNNLQIISSLLNLQTRNIEDESTLSAMADGQNRVKAMALIHQKLYQNNDLASIKFKDYTSQLLNQIAGMYPELKDVKREVVAGHIELDIDTAIPIGLILSELITNAFKYAFTNGEGIITLTLEQTEHNYILEVQDTGPGLPKDFDLSTASSIGLRLVRRLSRQLYGTSDYEYKNGSRFIITFKDTLSRKKTA
jgi:two-component sensor histidine kinase/tetratricopeptide (TPR) repeat protein